MDEATRMAARKLARENKDYPKRALYAIEAYSYACIMDLNVHAGVAKMTSLFYNSKNPACLALIEEAFTTAKIQCDFTTFVNVARNIFTELNNESEYRFKTEEQVRELEEKERTVLKSAKNILITFLKALQRITENPDAYFRAGEQSAVARAA